MEAACKRHNELPHSSRLFCDLLYHYDRVASYYPAPGRLDSCLAAARAVDFPSDRRAALVETLREQNGDSESLDLLAQENTAAVLTGQQVGLFSGPCYTVYKALTAVKLARAMTEQGAPAVPVFWLASEDHDFAEVNHCWTFDSAHKPLALRLDGAGLDVANDRPVGDILLSNPPTSALLESLSGFPFGEEVGTLAAEAYREGRTLSEAFGDLVKKILGSHGLLFFDPMRPASRRLAAPLLRKAVEGAPDLTERLLARSQQLQNQGYHAQVHVEPQTSLFFLLEQGKRVTLERKNGDYHAKNARLKGAIRRFSSAELQDRGEDLSPNALLRPVAQDFIFPTAAYIGGPAELAYLAQSEVIYHQLLGRMPVAVPRSTFTILDARSRKLMKRYSLGFESFFHGEDALREHIGAKLIPAELEATLEEAGAHAGADLDRLRGEFRRFDATLAAALEKSCAKIQYQLAKMRRKAGREMLRRDERAREEAAFLSNLLYPHKHLQERFYSILPFLAKHGLDLVDRLYENVHLDCPDHHLLFFD